MSITDIHSAKQDRERERLEKAVTESVMNLFEYMRCASTFALPLTQDRALYVIAGEPEHIKGIAESLSEPPK